MAKAVVTLEGDSSSLVKSIDQAKGSMQKLDAEGKTLTKQLREVATEADKAAGALVNKIGGPGAIKAIAGVGAAFVAVEGALGAFSSSMAAFAATQGAAGAKAMADLDTALNELQGQLFTAVMGTDDMETAMDTLIPIVQGLTTAFQLLLVPVTSFSGFIQNMATDHSAAATQAREHAKAEKEYETALAAANGQMKTAHEGYAGVERSIIGLLGTKRELAIFDLQETQRQYQMIVLQQDRAMQARRLAAGDFASAQAESTKRSELVDAEATKLQASEDKLERMGKENRRGRSADQIRELAEGRVARDKNAQLILESVGQQARQQSNAALTAQELGFKAERDRLIEAQKRIEALKTQLQNAKDRRVTGGSTPDAVAPVTPPAAAEPAMDPYEARRLDGERFLENERLLAEEELKILASTNKARQAMFGSANDEQIQKYYEVQIEKRIADQEEFDAARARAIELGDLKFNLAQSAAEFAAGERAKEKAAHDEKVNQLTAGFQEYGKLAGQQLAAGEKAADVAEKLAKKALGAQISALGDKAMVEAAIYAAAFNPMAIPMAAAGVAAYTAAAYLGAEGKKATTATPAAAAPAAGPVNTAFNLRVDAAFADGESIARQFAMMQRSAQRRGLVPVGA